MFGHRPFRLFRTSLKAPVAAMTVTSLDSSESLGVRRVNLRHRHNSALVSDYSTRQRPTAFAIESITSSRQSRSLSFAYKANESGCLSYVVCRQSYVVCRRSPASLNDLLELRRSSRGGREAGQGTSIRSSRERLCVLGTGSTGLGTPRTVRLSLAAPGRVL